MCSCGGYPTSSPSGGSSSRARAELQLHVAGRTDICTIELRSGASAPEVILLDLRS
jgi:hypothetical protein